MTGGAGYIGSTICSALQDEGYLPIVLDDLSTGSSEFAKSHRFYQGDISSRELIRQIFADHPNIYCAIHCAAKVIVPDSVKNPHLYYRTNVAKSVEFFRNLVEVKCNKIIFSSSASVYKPSDNFLVDEDSITDPKSPYARTKFMVEMILRDYSSAYHLNSISLRYFNPIGADPLMRSGLLSLSPTHILGRLIEVARGRSDAFSIAGTNWPTRDGTAIRDYIHVWDLAQAHVKAIESFNQIKAPQSGESGSYQVLNIGTGEGVTVKEFIEAFELVYGHKIKKLSRKPRPGDVAGVYANPRLANGLLGWHAKLSTSQAISDALEWDNKRDNTPI